MNLYELVKTGKTGRRVTCDREEACSTEICMCKLIRSMSGFGPVTNPRRIPELRTLEKESNLKTRPSVSIERKLVGRLAPNYKGIEFK